MKKVYFLLICTLLLSFISCDFEIEDIPRQRELVDISLDTTYAQLVYPQNTPKLETRGLRIFGHYSDGTTDEIDVNNAKITGFDSTSEGPVTIDVEFRGIHKKYEINIGEDTPAELKIVNYPIKLLYLSNDYQKAEFNYEGLSVNVQYKSGNNITLGVQDLNIQKNGTLIDHKQKITIYYEQLSTDFVIYVFEPNTLYNTFGTFPSSIFNNSYYITDSFNFTIHSSENKIPTYKIGDVIKLTDASLDDIDIKITKYDSTGKEVSFMNRPLNECNIQEVGKTVSKDMSYIYANINGKKIPVRINIIDKYIQGASLTIKDDFYKINYKGKEIDFTDETLFVFNRLFGDSITEAISFNNGKIKNNGEFEELRYSSEDKGFDNALPINTSYTIKNSGVNKVYFYYKCYSKKSQRNEVFPFEATIFVQDAKLEYLEVKYTKDRIKFDEKNSNYLSDIGITSLKGIKTDGTQCTLYDNNTVQIVNKTSVKKADFTKDNDYEITAEIEISYRISDDTRIKTKDNIKITLYIDKPANS